MVASTVSSVEIPALCSTLLASKFVDETVPEPFLSRMNGK